MIAIVLVDDQPMIRAGLRSILSGPDMTIVGEASNGREGLDVITRTRPDVVLMDLRMPVLDGVAAITALRSDEVLQRTGVLVLTTFDGSADVLAAVRAGADGFIGKAAEPDDLLAAVRQIAAGRPALSETAQRALISHAVDSPSAVPDQTLAAAVATLTPRERDIVRQAALGNDNGRIAQALYISPHTVKTHLNRAMTKLGVGDRGALVSVAFRSGLSVAE